MSKVLPVGIKERPELNLRQGIKSSLNSWRPLLATLYLFYLYSHESGSHEYGKEVCNGGKTELEVEEKFAAWLESHCSTIHGIKALVKGCPLYLAQIEHLQVGLELFLKLGKVKFADQKMSDSKERTGGNRYLKRVRFSTNMMILADVISAYSEEVRIDFLQKWLNGIDDDVVSGGVKELLTSFTEECQYKIRTNKGECFFQQEGIYECLRNEGDTVESSDVHESVGPFRILKTYVKEGMHPYIEDGKEGFKRKGDATAFATYAEMVSTSLSLMPKRTTVYHEEPQSENLHDAPLTSALRLFKEMRNEFAMGEKVNEGIRAYFDPLTEEGLRNFTEEQFTDLFLGKEKYEHMWSGTNGKGWGHIKKVGREAAMNFIADLKAIPVPAEVFCDKDFDAPSGFGRVTIAELQLKFNPTEFCAYSKRTATALRMLKLDEREFNGNFTATDYNAVLSVTETIRGRMETMGIGRTRSDDSKPDYLTANEFIDFVVENEDLIKEKVMKEQLKPVAEKLTKYGKKGLKEALKDDEMLRRLAAALRTKPFAILAGHSGTGKSSLVRRLAYMTCADEDLLKEADENTLPGNYCMVQVKPNWHDSIDLLGSYSDLGGRHYQTTPFVEFVCKAYAHPSVPFFVCLDEMNLAPVEHYFAEYLSAIESAELRGGVYMTDPVVSVDRDGEKKAKPDVLLQIMGKSASTNAADWLAKHDLTLPGNLFVVGTVNMDETTCQFSRKVLDRAMTILMDKVDFDSMAKDLVAKDEVLDKDAVDFFLGHKLKCGKLDAATQVARLNALKEPLANTPFAIAYRFANEYGLYQEAITQLLPDTEKSEASDIALDHLVLMKLLPRIHGERAAVRAIFTGEGGKGGLCAVLKDGLSKTQMMSILERKDEYLTFWP